MLRDMKRTIAIVGGGAIGSAIAYFLCADPDFSGEVVVIERDPRYARASSALSASSIRQQFSTRINIELSRYGVEFLRRAGELLEVQGERPEVGLREPGYLFLASRAGEPVLRRNHQLQSELGAEVALLDPQQLRARFPWISAEGVALASLGLSGEGWFDGWSLLQALRRKARSLGARYLEAEADGFEMVGEDIRAVRLADGGRVECATVVNAAGAWARRVAAWAGVELPVHARRRSVFVFDCPTPLPACPLVVDTSGLWFRPEGAGYICGISPPESEDADDLPLEPEHALFEERLWPVLASRVPAFEALRQTRAWAGYYEYNSYDHNGIVGAHPQIPGLLFANGFSGHGLQQSPAVGRAVAELIVHGGYRTLDLAPLAFERIARGQPVLELNVV
jgi:FAD-dependent oxidoreductase domain-containing protein 1